MAMAAEEKRAAHKRSAHRWYLKHREVRNAQRARRRASDPAHRATLDAKATAYRKTHTDAVNATRRARTARLRAMKEQARALERQARAEAARLQRIIRQRASQRRRRAQNREAFNARQRDYRRTHPEETRASDARKRAKRRAVTVRDFTAAQWREMQAAYDHCCAYCGKRCKGKLTQDHITPLSAGGDHTATNIVPACRSCNSRKQAGPLPTCVQPLLLLIAPALKKKAS